MLELLLLLPLLGADESATVSAPPTPALLERVCVVGASVSDGFGLNVELGLRLDFGDVLEAAFAQPGEVDTFATMWFFRDPLGTGQEQQASALELEPTLVVAVDYLFWFGYGYLSEERRGERLEQGLALLDSFDCPLLVGDLPDMRRAAEEGTSPLGVPLIYPGQVPEPQTLAAMNARITAWAAERERVAIVPLSEFVARMNDDQGMEVRGNRVAPGEADRFMQEDLLHPNLDGTLLLAAIALDRIVGRGVLADDAVHWQGAAIRARIEELHAAELEKIRERERRREERRKAREERRQEEGR